MQSWRQSTTGYRISGRRSRLSLQEKLALLSQMRPEERAELVRRVMKRFIEMARRDRRAAALAFLAWLQTEDGAVLYPLMFKERYRVLMVDIAYYTLKGLQGLLRGARGKGA